MDPFTDIFGPSDDNDILSNTSLQRVMRKNRELQRKIEQLEREIERLKK